MSFIIPAKETVKAILILMHGYGTSASDFAQIGDYFSKHCSNIEVHILDAFHEMNGPNCRCWFDLESNNLSDWKTNIQPAGDELVKYIDKVLDSHKGLSYKNVILSGFSQGAMMSLHVGLMKNVGAIVAFSGLLLDQSVVKRTNIDTDVLLIHGDNDTVLPIDYMEEAATFLFKNNVKCAKYIERGMDHSINHNCLSRSLSFIQSFLDNQ